VGNLVLIITTNGDDANRSVGLNFLLIYSFGDISLLSCVSWCGERCVVQRFAFFKGG
jgi:hypothetical protein